ncbi:MAG: hypothetical protein HWN65_24375, partial [Candidatus Helarchaeota archaeon]|nr:hypothetical protein [Candidatus Helarchaeota archaeon]
MDAPTRVLKALNHEEPDRVPAFESTFTNDTITAHYGVKSSFGTIKFLLNLLGILPFKNRIVRWSLKKRSLVIRGFKPIFEFFRKVKLDIGLSICSGFPRKMIKGGFIGEYGRIMKFEKYKEDGTLIVGYHGGYFRDFN